MIANAISVIRIGISTRIGHLIIFIGTSMYDSLMLPITGERYEDAMTTSLTIASAGTLWTKVMVLILKPLTKNQPVVELTPVVLVVVHERMMNR